VIYWFSTYCLTNFTQKNNKNSMNCFIADMQKHKQNYVFWSSRDANLLLLTQKPTGRYIVCSQLSICSVLGTEASDMYFSLIGVHYEVKHSQCRNDIRLPVCSSVSNEYQHLRVCRIFMKFCIDVLKRGSSMKNEIRESRLIERNVCTRRA
jgi:hypothetical protein